MIASKSGPKSSSFEPVGIWGACGKVANENARPLGPRVAPIAGSVRSSHFRLAEVRSKERLAITRLPHQFDTKFRRCRIVTTLPGGSLRVDVAGRRVEVGAIVAHIECEHLIDIGNTEVPGVVAHKFGRAVFKARGAQEFVTELTRHREVRRQVIFAVPDR